MMMYDFTPLVVAPTMTNFDGSLEVVNEVFLTFTSKNTTDTVSGLIYIKREEAERLIRILEKGFNISEQFG